MLRTKNLLPVISRYHMLLKYPPHHRYKQQQKEIITEKLVFLLNQSVSLKQLQEIHTQMLVNSIPKPNFILCKIIELKDFTYASLFFSHIPVPNEYAFSFMIRGLAKTWQNYSLALQFYYQMRFSGLKPNNFTFPFLFVACTNLLAVNHGRSGHSLVFKFGWDGNDHVSNSLITMYARFNELDYARKVFDEIRERDLVSWNSMISGYLKIGYAAEAIECFERMREDGFEPDEMTLVSVLRACGDLGNLILGSWIEEFFMSNKMELNSYMGSALIGMYGKCGDLLSARRVFDKMPKKDVVIWNAMITGYAQNGSSTEAIVVFNGMREVGIDPDKITLAEALSACASFGALDLGKRIETYAFQRGLQHDIYVATALIDMYAKCGSLDNARRVFKEMPQKNEVSWNAMISALAFHGRAQEALLLFKCMSEAGETAHPNDITFVGLLSACVHAGLVDEGRQIFHVMSSSFGLIPKIEHYSCMVDLMARAGHIYEAWDFVAEMPGKPDEVVLGILLCACQKRRNVDVGEWVMQLLLDMEPSNSGNYIISSKIYANVKNWDESAKMRVLMREKGVSKTPGCSWIEIDAQLYEFHAGSNLDTQPREMLEVFGLLNEEMKIEGYTPKVDYL
ncbi:pentatricopeptide repeat-containing protein [Tripterygium wilfordii]|uniref:Pentatricopeptide repeat-containing protein n=1 Tax=Tripterygium wilfordii TaxID=458696 RepID=A0A7J7DSX1_TRIWF|nr:pentatricopeptide repeat-containing protein At2g34400 [Tripterygium wilfordii]KAF5749379.1 pentatricopeptide repeat-containing protein [Tripterygium wilfordii]